MAAEKTMNTIYMIMNSDEPKFPSMFYDFYLDQKLVDTIIILSDGCILAHGIILASRSEVLLRMLEQQTEPQKTVSLKKFGKSIMKHIVELCYRGEILYPKKIEAEIFRVIDSLQINVKQQQKSQQEKNVIEEPPTHEDVTEGLPPDQSVIEVLQPDQSIIVVVDDSEIEPDNSMDFLLLDENPEITDEDDATEDIVNSDNSPETSPFLQRPPFLDETQIEEVTSSQKDRAICVKNPFASYRKKRLNVASSGVEKAGPSNRATSSPPQRPAGNGSWATTKEKSELSLKYCVTCKKKKKSLRKHIKIHKKPIQKPNFTCRFCKTRFFKRIFFTAHQQTCSQK